MDVLQLFKSGKRAIGRVGRVPAAWAGATDRATRGTRRCSDTPPTSRPSPCRPRSRASVGLVGVEGCQGDLQDLGNFFWRAMIVSARCSFRWSLRFSASNCFTRGSIGRGVGPRRRPRMSRRAPCSRCRRQFAKCELYKPSRRSSAPSSPGRLHASACLRMRSRYAAVNRRRWAFADTSGSGAVAADVAVGPTLISIRRLSHRSLAQGARPAPRATHDRDVAHPPGGVRGGRQQRGRVLDCLRRQPRADSLGGRLLEALWRVSHPRLVREDHWAAPPLPGRSPPSQRRPLSVGHRPHAVPPANGRLRCATYGRRPHQT